MATPGWLRRPSTNSDRRRRSQIGRRRGEPPCSTRSVTRSGSCMTRRAPASCPAGHLIQPVGRPPYPCRDRACHGRRGCDDLVLLIVEASVMWASCCAPLAPGGGHCGLPGGARLTPLAVTQQMADHDAKSRLPGPSARWQLPIEQLLACRQPKVAFDLAADVLAACCGNRASWPRQVGRAVGCDGLAHAVDSALDAL